MSSTDIITVSEKGQLVLPKTVRESLGIKKGTKVLVLCKGKNILLTKMNDEIHERFFTLLASEKSLAKLWNHPNEDRAWKNL